MYLVTHTSTHTHVHVRRFENRENSLQRKIAVCAIFHFGVWRVLFFFVQFLPFSITIYSLSIVVVVAVVVLLFYYYYFVQCTAYFDYRCVQPTTAVVGYSFILVHPLSSKNSFTTCTLKLFYFQVFFFFGCWEFQNCYAFLSFQLCQSVYFTPTHYY